MKREFIFSDKWLDLLFEKRNRLYGAYILRKRLPDNVLIGYASAVLLMGAMLFALYRFSAVTIDDVIKAIKSETRDLKTFEVKIDQVKSKSITENSDKKNFDKQAPKNTIPVVVDSATMIDDSNKNKEPETKNGSNSSMGKDSAEGAVDNPSVLESSSNEPKLWVPKMPEYPGGDPAMFKFMRDNTTYPGRYLQENIPGIVYVSFVIDTTGKVTDIKVERGVVGFPEFENAAVQSISKMPRWTPGRQNSANVSVKLTMPVRFDVKKDF